MSIVAQSVALAAANQLHGIWGDDLDVEVDTSRVDRMAGTQSGSHTGGAMSIDELGGGEELWKLSDDEPSPPGPSPPASGRGRSRRRGRGQIVPMSRASVGEAEHVGRACASVGLGD